MRPLRRSLSLFLPLLLSALLAACAAGGGASSSPPDTAPETGDLSAVEIHTLSETEAADYYMLEQDCSPTDARMRASSLTRAGQSLAAHVAAWETTDELGQPAQIQLGCFLLVGPDGPEELLNSWTNFTGSAGQSWTEFTHSAALSDADPDRVDFYVRGTLNHAVAPTDPGDAPYHARTLIEREGSFSLSALTPS